MTDAAEVLCEKDDWVVRLDDGEKDDDGDTYDVVSGDAEVVISPLESVVGISISDTSPSYWCREGDGDVDGERVKLDEEDAKDDG